MEQPSSTVRSLADTVFAPSPPLIDRLPVSVASIEGHRGRSNQRKREVFVVQRPRADTVERIRGFLQSYWGAERR